MNQWSIDVWVTLPEGMNDVMAEYACACTIQDNGIPVNPFNGVLQSGELKIEIHGNKRHYTWIGPDIRS